MIFWIWIFTITLAIVQYFRHVYSRFSKKGVKHLTFIPPFGTMAKGTLRMEHFVDIVEKSYFSFPEERFVGSMEFTTPVVVLRDLDLIKKITIKDFEYFLDHRLLIQEDVEPLFGKNLFALKGQKWKDMRSTLSPAFTSLKIRAMVPFMNEVGEQMTSALDKKIKASKEDYIDVDYKDLLTRYANDVIASCAFGLKVDSHSNENNEFYKRSKIASNFSFLQILVFFGYAAFPKLMTLLRVPMFSESSRQFFKNLVQGSMREREVNNIIRKDMIQLLMEAKKVGRISQDESSAIEEKAGFATVEESAVGKKENRRVWSDDDLTAQAVLFFIAGFETISVGMAFMLHELALHPEMQDRLVNEIKEAYEKCNGNLDYNTIQQMTYLDMVVSETLRLWTPAIAMDRLCMKDYNLGKPNDKATEDFVIRKDEGISIPAWAIHRDSQYFPDPLKFDPERFSEENVHKINPMTYFPFGLGPRNCIGSRFALCEMKVMACHLLDKFELTPCEKTVTENVKLSLETFNLRIEGGHWLRFKMRTS